MDKRKAATTRKSDAMKFLDELIGEPMTLGSTLENIRATDGHTLAAFAEKLGISRTHLNDIEKGTRNASPERAAKWAEALGYPAELFVSLAVQDSLAKSGLNFSVSVAANTPRPTGIIRAANDNPISRSREVPARSTFRAAAPKKRRRTGS